MIWCMNCKDTKGPWIYINGTGFICEDCYEKKKKMKKPTRKERIKKNEDANICSTGCVNRI